MNKTQIKESLKIDSSPYLMEGEEFTLIKITSSIKEEYEYSVIVEKKNNNSVYVGLCADDAGYEISKQIYGKRKALAIWHNAESQ